MSVNFSSVSSRNAKATLAVTFFSDLSFILPIWILFGTEQLRLSVTTTTILFMTLWLGSGLLEIPTGALADRYGRKKMFMIGALLLALYPIVYIFELPVLVIFLVSVISAFGSALRSGALVPVVHDSYQKQGRSDGDYHKFLSNSMVLTFIARALSGVTGGILFAVNPKLPYVANFGSYLAIILCGLFVIDTATDRSTLSNRLHIKETLSLMKRVPIVVALLVSYIAFQLVAEAAWTAYQPLFKSDGITPEGIGLIFSTIAILSAIGAYGGRHLMKRAGVLKIELLVGAMIFVTCAMLVIPSLPIRVLAVVPAGVMFGITLLPIIATTQKHIAQKFHSTALSVISLFQYVVYGVASVYIAFIIDAFGTETTRKILLAEAFIMMAVLLGIYIRYKRWDEVATPKDVAAKDPAVIAA